jgi:hypothetical protein
MHAQQDERAVRAAYVYNLTKYVYWPHNGNELLIGVVGDKSMDQALKSVVDGKRSDERVIHILLHPSDADLARCDMVYFAGPATAYPHDILDHPHTSSTLTVGEDDHFVLSGGMVALIRTGDQIQLEVNPDAANAAGLRISSRLLNLAVIVDSGKRG